MEIPIIKLNPENFITVALLSAAAYLGVIGIQKAISLYPKKS